MTNYSELIENSLSNYLSQAGFETLVFESARYSLMNAGKRIRPYLCLLITDMLCGNVMDAVPFACAIEMIHSYSLIHDDLPAMDNDDLRRGKPSNHIVYGEGNAILAGDALLTLAANILVHQNNRLAADAVIRGALDMLNGQSLDINIQDIDDSVLFKMYDGKTGGLFCASILSAYFVANGSSSQSEAWKKFALNLGRLFQITDDILDLQKDSEEGKTTYLSLHSIDEAKQYSRDLEINLIDFLKPYKNEAADKLITLISSLPNRKK